MNTNRLAYWGKKACVLFYRHTVLLWFPISLSILTLVHLVTQNWPGYDATRVTIATTLCTMIVAIAVITKVMANHWDDDNEE